jgi:hypothetical protein
MQTKFLSPYHAGYDAGQCGANAYNTHFSFFSTKERMQEWQRGNDDGSKKRAAEQRTQEMFRRQFKQQP